MAIRGVNFTSLDDVQAASFKFLMDQICGEQNYIDTIIWEKKYRPQNDAAYFSTNHDYVFCYAKKRKNNI
jgi:adenine-specific DNA-methyltransferase